MKTVLGILGSASLLAAASAAAGPPDISTQSLLAHIRTLASDEFEGRAPGSRGEAKTVAYLEQQLRALGLKPGNPNGSYVQPVPMRSSLPAPVFSYSANGKSTLLRYPDDYVAQSSGPQAQVSVKNSELVFVGYGVVAPEYGWDDYKGMDLRGKTLLVLINDPAIPDPADATRLDPAMFKGSAMTYYGRWTYKYEMAARLGAAGALIVHETKPAAYPYDTVRNSFGGENFSLVRSGPDPDAPAVPGWIHLDRARELVAAAGYDFDTLKQSALSRNFRPVGLKALADFDIANRQRALPSNNVVGLIEGSDPKLKHEYVIYSAHWDAFGMDHKLPGPPARQVFHGALDNASGVGGLLELARAFKALPVAPKRSILFLFTTAEERNMLGAKYYTANPLYPLERTLADINLDGLNAWGPTAQIEHVTAGHSTLDDILVRHAQTQGRAVVPDSVPQNGTFYRADQVEFARAGVPVVFTKSRSNYIGKPESYAREVVDRYYGTDYHKVSDDVRDDWDLRGAAQDLELLFQVGLDVANGAVRPQWKAGSEFRRP